METDALTGRPRRSFPAGAIVATGTLLAIGGLMAAHAVAPWPTRPILLLRNNVLPLLALFFLLLYFWGWGAIAAKVLRLNAPERPPALAVLPLGICVAVLWLFVTGVLGGFRLGVMIVTSLIVIPCGLWLQPLRRPRWDWTRRERILIALNLLCSAYLLIGNLQPLSPSAAFDSLAYHLAMGKIFLREGRIIALPWMTQAQWPFSTDMVFFHGLIVGGETPALLLNFVFHQVAAVAVYHLVLPHAGRGYALLAMLAFLVTPEARTWVDTCVVEIGWTCFSALALWAVLEWRRRRRPGWLELGAIFTGFTLGSKIGAVPIACGLGLLVLTSAVDLRRGLGSLAAPLRFTLLALAVAAPSYLKAFVVTGTPVWPFTFGLFTLRDWPPATIHRILTLFDQFAGPYAPTLSNLLLTPWRRRAHLEIVLLVTLVLATAARRRWRAVLPFVVVAGCGYLTLFTVSRQERFLLPAVPAIIAGLMVATVPRPGSRVERLGFALLWIGILMMSGRAWLLSTHRSPQEKLSLALGLVSREDIRARNRLYRASMAVNANTRPGDRIVLFGEVRGYYLERDYAWGDPLAQPFIDYARLQDVTALALRLQQLGYTHLLFTNPAVSDFYPARAVTLMNTLLLGARQVLQLEGYRLFDLRGLQSCAWRGAPAQALAAALQRTEWTPPATLPTNLVANGGFDQGMTGWINDHRSTVEVVPGGINGGAALRLRPPPARAGEAPDVLPPPVLWTAVPAQPGGRYIAGAYLRTIGQAGRVAGLSVLTVGSHSREMWHSPHRVSGDSEWTLVVLPFEVPAGARQVRVLVPQTPELQTGEIMVDDVFVWPIEACADGR